MRITRIELFKAEIAFLEPFRISLATSTAARNVFVRIHAEGGLYGIGEASPTRAITGDTQATAWAVGQDLAALLIGREATDIEGANALMRRNIAGETSIRGAFDNALYDLAAKAASMPLYAYLGGARREYETDNTVSIDTPAIMAGKARRFIDEGFRAVKVKLGTGAAEDIARVEAIRDAIGEGIPIRVDANQGWDAPTATRILRAIEDLGVEYAEQPVAHWDTDSMRRVRESVGIPIMADESLFSPFDAARLASDECCDYFNIKLAKSAGIGPALKIAAIAEAHGIACMVGCMSETRLGLTAAAHLVSARPIIRFADLDSHVDHEIDPVTGGMTIVDGLVHLPDGIGVGADLNPEFLESCERAQVG